MNETKIYQDNLDRVKKAIANLDDALIALNEELKKMEEGGDKRRIAITFQYNPAPQTEDVDTNLKECKGGVLGYFKNEK